MFPASVSLAKAPALASDNSVMGLAILNVPIGTAVTRPSLPAATAATRPLVRWHPDGLPTASRSRLCSADEWAVKRKRQPRPDVAA